MSLEEEYIAPQEIQDARLAVCATCPSKDPAQDFCNACGCVTFMKARIIDQFCPEGKWENSQKIELNCAILANIKQQRWALMFATNADALFI